MWEKAKSVQWVGRASARSEFDKLLAQTPAEILRVDMASVYMDLKDWPFPCFAMLLTWHCILIPGYSPQALGISKIVDCPLVRSSVTLLLCSSSSSEWENREIHWRHGVPNGVALYQHLSKSWWPVEHRGTSWNIVEHRGTSWNIAEHRGTRYDMIWHDMTDQSPSLFPRVCVETVRWTDRRERRWRKLPTFSVASGHWTPRMLGPHTRTSPNLPLFLLTSKHYQRDQKIPG